eukprot:1150048-Pelagomonas_calceolata.AAC.2
MESDGKFAGIASVIELCNTSWLSLACCMPLVDHYFIKALHILNMKVSDIILALGWWARTCLDC